MSPGAVVYRIRNKLARAIATRDQVFSSDMSIVVDRLTIEVESLREQVRSIGVGNVLRLPKREVA